MAQTSRFLVLLSLFTLVGCSVQTRSLTLGKPGSFSVTGGVEGDPNDGGSSVLLYQSTEDDSWICTGSAISRRIIVTAAHCLRDTSNTSLKVVVDRRIETIDQLEQLAKRAIPVSLSNIVLHPKYKSTSNYLLDGQNYDVGLIKLSVDLPKSINPIEIVPRNVVAKNVWVEIGGYGPEYLDRNYFPLVLRKAKVRASQIQNDSSKDILTDNVLSDSPVGPSEGDSGGPLIIKIDDRSFLAGVYSGGQAYNHHKNSYFEDLNLHRDWLSQAMESK